MTKPTTRRVVKVAVLAVLRGAAIPAAVAASIPPAASFVTAVRSTVIPPGGSCLETVRIENHHAAKFIAVRIAETQHLQIAGDLPQSLVVLVPPRGATEPRCSWWRGAARTSDFDLLEAWFEEGPPPEPATCNDLSCEARRDVASDSIEAVRLGDLSCWDDDDCALVDASTACEQRCPAAVAADARESVLAAVRAAEASCCEGYAEAGCEFETPPCAECAAACVDWRCEAVCGMKGAPSTGEAEGR